MSCLREIFNKTILDRREKEEPRAAFAELPFSRERFKSRDSSLVVAETSRRIIVKFIYAQRGCEAEKERDRERESGRKYRRVEFRRDSNNARFN